MIVTEWQCFWRHISDYREEEMLAAVLCHDVLPES